MSVSTALPLVRSRLLDLARRESIEIADKNHPEDGFFLLMSEGARGVFWAAARRQGSVLPDDFPYGGMVKI